MCDYTDVGCKFRTTTHTAMILSQKIMNEEKAEIQIINNKITKDTVLFFDMDGTLVDTDYANFLAYKNAIISVTNSNHDLTYNPDRRFNRCNLKTAVPNLTKDEYEKIIRKKEECFNDFLHETKINKETVDILFKYSKTNKSVLVSNCRKDRAMATLKHFGLEEKFSDIFCREFEDNDQKINKFQNALSKLGVPPKFVIVFENEDAEITNAHKEGILIVNPTNL